MLWDDLGEFDSCALNDALAHCMRCICEWIGAQNAFWIGAVRMVDGKESAGDPSGGWRIGAIEVLNPEYTSRRRLRTAAKSHQQGEPDPGDTTRVVVAEMGQFRAYSLGTGVVDLKTFRKTDHYDYFYRQPGISDRIWVISPINDRAESYFIFDKYGKGRRFRTADLKLAAAALRGIKWFHRELLLCRGLGISQSPLAPAERRVVLQLLSGVAEKVIAQRLKLTRATVHHYVTDVYRKFGVRGRSEFMSLWLRGRL
jgi:DNA-binding CsgD family transcriptional regulator